MASPTYAATGTTVGGGVAANIDIPVPAGMAANEVACLLLYIESDTAVTWPAGFDLIATAENNTAGDEHRTYLAAKRASGADSGNYSVTHASAWRSGVAFRLSGVLTTGTLASIVQATQGATTVAGTASPALSLTTTTADTLLIYLASNFNGGATWTPPTGMTERVDAEEWSVNSLAQAAAGSTGSLSATASASGSLTSVLAAFPSLAAGGTAVGKSLDTRWNTRAALGDTINPRWNVRALVSDSPDLRWSVRTTLGDTTDARWSVRAAVGDPADLRWQVRSALGDTINAQWGVRSALGDTLNPQWSVRATAGDSAGLVWNVLSAASVGDTVDLRWGVRAALGDTLNPLWSVRTTATDSVDARWAARTVAAKASDQRWSVRMLASDTLNPRWDVIATAGVVGTLEGALSFSTGTETMTTGALVLEATALAPSDQQSSSLAKSMPTMEAAADTGTTLDASATPLGMFESFAYQGPSTPPPLDVLDTWATVLGTWAAQTETWEVI